MAHYLILLYNEPTWMKNLSPEEMQQALEKYSAWRKKPFTVDGKRLADDAGKVLRKGAEKARVTDGPYSESKEALGGFYVIEAANYDEAVKIAEEHPHLHYGGTIELRHVFGT